MTDTSVEIQPIVIGTAGHIDHGKSSLVEALTRIDPDLLKEEQERGLTIDLGFAPLELEDGRLVGIVDVPGHERFVRNMVAGATGIDLVLLVVAADDGVMPQTREHLDITLLCGVTRGLVALTKVDVVDAELAELAADDVRELLAGTPLADAPILPVSSVTGEGIDALRAQLSALALEVEPRAADGVFRMPIQRVFSKPGFGTVVTGIPVAGQVAVGDAIEILPAGVRGKVRGIQAYGHRAERARAGHSTALNVSDVERTQVRRGCVAAAPGVFGGARMLGARLEVVASAQRAVGNRMPVRLHVGTADVPGEVILLDAAELAPGETGLVQLRLDEPVVCAPGDRFVLRRLSPAETLGGGVVLEESRFRLKRFKGFVLEELSHQEESLATPAGLVESVLARSGERLVAVEELVRSAKLPADEVRASLDALAGERRALQLAAGRWIHADRLDAALAKLCGAIDAWLERHPLRSVVDVRELRSEAKLDAAFAGALLEVAAERGEVALEGGGRVRRTGRTVELDPAQAELRDALLAKLAEDPFQPPTAAELAASVGAAEGAAEALLEHLVDQGELVHVGGGLFLQVGAIERARAAITASFERHGHLEIPELRDELRTTRKYLIPLLEHFDAVGFTIRQGAHRVLRSR